MELNEILNRFDNKYNFNPATSIPDLGGGVFVITGGNNGLGLHSVMQIAQHNPHRLYLTARSRTKFETAMVEIQKKVPTANNFIRFIEMDTSSFLSVKQAADQILLDTNRIDVLMNNAGVMGAAASLTKEGYEVHFGTNHMGHALLTKLLLPLLLTTAEKSGTDVRIVNVSSGAFRMADDKTGFSPELVKTDMKDFSGSGGNLLSRYGQSKLANVLHVKALAKRYPTITSVAIAPGRVKTGLLSDLDSSCRDIFYKYFQKTYDWVIGAHTVEHGAYTQVWAATEPNKERVKSGEMYNPVGLKTIGTKHSENEALADTLWDFQVEEFKKHGY